MKKNNKFTAFAVIALFFIVILISIASGDNRNWDNFARDMVKKGFFPAEIFNGLQDFNSQLVTKDTETLKTWSAVVQDEETYVHKMQIIVNNASNKLLFYQYNNYNFDYSTSKEPLTKDQGREIALNFIKTFVPDGKNLSYVNLPNDYPPLYKPDHVESWSAYNSSGKKFLVMVDLQLGYVVFYYTY